ncbi:MAG: hypothetical protein WED05_10630 [Candidatus Atabeyarchaeum deiterrae]
MVEEPSNRSDEGNEKPTAAEKLLFSIREMKEKVDGLSKLINDKVMRPPDPSVAADSLHSTARTLKEAGDYISVNLSGVTFKDLKGSMETLNKTIKDMTFVISGLDVRVKGMTDLLSSVVKNTRELSEDIKSNTALMNMLMRALDTTSMERESQLLKNMQTSTALIEKFTALVKTQIDTAADRED